MAHTLNNQKSLLTRARLIKGHAASLETALESGLECLKVAAVRGAVNGLMSELLEGHIRNH